MKNAVLSLLLAVSVVGCASVDMPKGTSKGYSSVRFVDKSPGSGAAFAENSVDVNQIIHDAVADNFTAHGFEVGGSDAELIVAYLLILQNNVTTAAIGDYFGYNSDKSALADLAHKEGVIKGRHREKYEAGAIVIDLVDAETQNLVYRNYAKRDIVRELPDDQREQRIHDAVNEALADFFR